MSIKDNNFYRKRGLSPRERAELDNLRAESENTKALQDYNIMMGNIEDPSEDEEEEGEE